MSESITIRVPDGTKDYFKKNNLTPTEVIGDLIAGTMFINNYNSQDSDLHDKYTEAIPLLKFQRSTYGFIKPSAWAYWKKELAIGDIQLNKYVDEYKMSVVDAIVKEARRTRAPLNIFDPAIVIKVQALLFIDGETNAIPPYEIDGRFPCRNYKLIKKQIESNEWNYEPTLIDGVVRGSKSESKDESE